MKIGKKSIASMSLLFMNLSLSSCQNEEVFKEKNFEINSEEVKNLSINFKLIDILKLTNAKIKIFIFLILTQIKKSLSLIKTKRVIYLKCL